MSASTRPPSWREPRTPEQAGLAATHTIGAVMAGRPRWPARYEPEPDRPPQLDEAGDYAAWLAAQRRARNHTWAQSYDPDRYGRTRW